MWLALLLLAGDPATQKAVDYLSREVPAWRAENGCFSCHNNGDGARALFLARKMGYRVASSSLTETQRWLNSPADWDTKSKRPEASDLKLARLQFAVAASSPGGETQAAALTAAAKLLTLDQLPDGSWRIGTGDMAGSPITWGSVLATALAVQVPGLPAASRQRGLAWLQRQTPNWTVDLAGVLLALPNSSLDPLLQRQTTSGGWGPRRSTPPEIFDTAIALIALSARPSKERPLEAIRRGRKFLITSQLENGGWPETTRPSGQQSYAHHVSTSAWATLALLATDAERD